ncbi:MAG TPA: histidine kinase, partial [Elusimicrobia bacterium]|nr:histidine kinase [Elusimicrobiota bacterium]
MKCPNCGQEIKDPAANCPRCGGVFARLGPDEGRRG